MSKEANAGSNHRELEEIQQDLKRFLEDAEPGSPKILALSDHIEEVRVQEEIDNVIREILNYPETTPMVTSYSSLRILEAELALINRDVNRNFDTVPGYRVAYKVTEKLFQEYEDVFKLTSAPHESEDSSFYTQEAFRTEIKGIVN